MVDKTLKLSAILAGIMIFVTCLFILPQRINEIEKVESQVETNKETESAYDLIEIKTPIKVFVSADKILDDLRDETESQTESEEEETTIIDTTIIVEETIAATDGPQKSIYDVFSQEEIKLFAQVVKSEIGGGSFEAKTHVVSVIFNRMSYYNASLTDVIFAPEQFAVITSGVYLQMEVTQDILDAIQYVYENGDTTDGCRFFNTKGKNSYAAQHCEFVMCDGYHDLYR